MRVAEGMVMVTKRAITRVTRVASNKESDGEGGKRGTVTKRVMVMATSWAMATTTRVNKLWLPLLP